MSILSGEGLGHSFNDNWLFKDLTFGIARGQRVALVGINGSGKSTLLKILGSKLAPVEGRVVSERGLRIGYLEQDPSFENQDTIEDFIYSMDNKQQQLIRRYEHLLNTGDTDSVEFHQLTDDLSELNAWEYEHQIKTILQRLSIDNHALKIENLSGGQRKRLALAKLLIDDPDIFIIDEPTNHLDIEMIEWLESFFTTGQKTVLMVTHDRYFLDNICNTILELENRKLYIYNGKYAYFLEKKAQREEEEQATLQKNKNLLKKELEWMRRQPQARATKSKSRIDAFYDLEDKTKNKGNNQKIELSTKVSRQGNKIMEIASISKAYDNKTLIRNFTYTFKKGDRIGIAGRNGTGKSTLLNLLTQKISPDNGEISVGETTVFGYYEQGGLSFDESERIIDIVKNVAEHIKMADGSLITASQLLTQFLFPPAKQYNPVSKLSGGEKKRLQLMRILMKNPNFLILDEPTNDLDIDTLNVLEDFLQNYSGILLLISHDRYLMDKLTDQLFILEGNEQVRIYNGNYSDYRLVRESELKAENIQKTRKQESTQPVKKKAKLSFKEQSELTALEAGIPELENKIMILSQKLNAGNQNHNELSKLAAEIDAIQATLDANTVRWMELLEIQEHF